MGKNAKVASAPAIIGALHSFDVKEIDVFRQKLLSWYDENKRVLPWRTIVATEPDLNKRIYAGNINWTVQYFGFQVLFLLCNLLVTLFEFSVAKTQYKITHDAVPVPALVLPVVAI